MPDNKIPHPTADDYTYDAETDYCGTLAWNENTYIGAESRLIPALRTYIRRAYHAEQTLHRIIAATDRTTQIGCHEAREIAKEALEDTDA